MSLNKLFISILAALSLSSCGEVKAASNDGLDKATALSVMKKYAEATSCMHSFSKDEGGENLTTIDDVYLIDSDVEARTITYYVFWSGDVGCAGGSGTFTHQLSEVGNQLGVSPLLVQNLSILDGLDMNARFIESVKQINKDEFEIIAEEMGDFGNYARYKFKYKVKRIDDSWKITKKTLLKKY